tara:strand:+ start:14 stop:472 length:459 start_codon:yes stop_codon:yes gene_type:complete
MVIWVVVKFTVNLEKLREDIKMAAKKIAEVFITEGFKLLKPVYDDFVKLYNKEKLKGNLDDVIGAKPPTPKNALVLGHKTPGVKVKDHLKNPNELLMNIAIKRSKEKPPRELYKSTVPRKKRMSPEDIEKIDMKKGGKVYSNTIRKASYKGG